MVGRGLICAALALLLVSQALAASRPGRDHGRFDGESARGADPNAHELLIVAVDGERDLEMPTSVQLAPGFHWLTVASANQRGRKGRIDSKSLPLNVQPCTTYHFFARHASALPKSPWEIVHVGTSLRPGCQPTSDPTQENG